MKGRQKGRFGQAKIPLTAYEVKSVFGVVVSARIPVIKGLTIK